MPNGIRLIDVTADIAPDTLLAVGSDKFGDPQALIGIIPVSAGSLDFIEISDIRRRPSARRMRENPR